MNANTSNPMGFTIEQARQYLMQGRALASDSVKPHSYSKTLALEHGSIAAALLLKYLEFCVRKSRPGADGIQRIIRSSAEISAHYPYLTASTIAAILKRIPEGVLRRKRAKSRKTGALSSVYSFADPLFKKSANSDLVYFLPTDAEKHGLHEAVLLHWLRFRIRKKAEKGNPSLYHAVSGTELAPTLGISRASISRAIRNLVDQGVLERNPKRNGKLSEYGIKPPPPAVALTLPVLNPGNGALTSR